MKKEFVNLERMTIAGLGMITTNEGYKAMKDIGETWGKFDQDEQLKSLITATNPTPIGLYTEYESDHTKPYLFVAGIITSEAVPVDYLVKEIPKGKYVKFTVEGDIKTEVGKAWMAIWQMDLGRTYIADFELYKEKSVEIYIGVK